MTSKEGLNCFLKGVKRLILSNEIAEEDKNIYLTDYNNIYQQIKKDLEVLEVLRNKVFNDKNFDLDIGYYDDYFNLTEEERKILKEWLTNEKED